MNKLSTPHPITHPPAQLSSASVKD